MRRDNPVPNGRKTDIKTGNNNWRVRVHGHLLSNHGRIERG